MEPGSNRTGVAHTGDRDLLLAPHQRRSGERGARGAPVQGWPGAFGWPVAVVFPVRVAAGNRDSCAPGSPWVTGRSAGRVACLDPRTGGRQRRHAPQRGAHSLSTSSGEQHCHVQTMRSCRVHLPAGCDDGQPDVGAVGGCSAARVPRSRLGCNEEGLPQALNGAETRDSQGNKGPDPASGQALGGA